MSIATEIQRIQNAKSSIKTAIENKGVVVGDGTIDTYAAKIDEISSGESNEIEIANASYLFYQNVRLEQMDDILKLCKNITKAERMFQNATNLENIDLSKINTSKLTSLGYFFGGCYRLKELDLSPLDTSNVTDMGNFIDGCYALKELDLSKIDTSKVETLSMAFRSCTGFTSFDLSKMATDSLTNIYYLVYGCSNLVDLNIGFDASKINNIGYAFNSCTKLTNLTFMNNLGKGYTQKSNNYANNAVDLSYCKNLTYESLMDVINKLYDLNLTYDVANGGTLYTQKLVLGSTNLAKLTEEEIAIATNKGWVVS